MLKRIVVIGLASTLIGIGVNVFILPFHLLNGGITGIGLLCSYLWDFKVGLTIICLNAPIYLMAFLYNRSYFFNGVYGMLCSSIMIDLLLPLRGIVHLPVIISAPLGGLFIGLGTGFMLRHKTSQGGIDLLALLLSKWFALNPGILIFVMDAFIISLGLLILMDGKSIYSLLTVLVSGFITSLMTSLQSVSIYNLRPRG
ncbi:uncharacterized membrane-anchored protein YitT (DUF2179 family) [Bacillus fengqiuensis]|nr:uncharacterized membrane-anchored protein YitT (DUF2179 family) [Bacillus fengqiuensis]